MRRPLAAALLLALAVLCGPGGAAAQAPGDREGLRSGPRSRRDHEIRWRDWTASAFADAKRDDRLVLLDLTAVWCHWCHVMDETSYSDPDVIRILNDKFVAIRVDADRHPEVRDRYLSGGWPTTAVLSPEGHVLVARTYLPPDQLERMLTEALDFYRKNRRDLDRKIEEAARQVRATWAGGPIDSSSLVDSKELIDRTIEALRSAEDKEHGGFGGEPRFHDSDAVTFLLRASVARGDSALRDPAIRAVDGLLKLQDTVWGGFYRYATKSDWSHPHYEKMLWENARAIESTLGAYRATRSRTYLAAARAAERYVYRWLWDDRVGGYFGSQDADVGSHDPSRPFTAGEDFYVLSDVFRRKVGAPRVDSTFYAEANARMASSLLRGVLSGVLEPSAAERPLRVLERLWRDQRAPNGSLYHAMAAGRGITPGLLADQVMAGQAYLDAYEATGDSRHLERARALAAWTADHLEDRAAGGFRYAPFDSTAVGRLLAGDKPASWNIEAATLFLRLHWLEDRPEDRAAAERTFALLRAGATVVQDPARALLALRLGMSPVRIAVVGARRSGAVRSLLEAAFDADPGEKVLRVFERGGSSARWGDVRFPERPSPALYVCGRSACAPPITDPGRVAAQIRAFLSLESR